MNMKFCGVSVFLRSIFNHFHVNTESKNHEIPEFLTTLTLSFELRFSTFCHTFLHSWTVHEFKTWTTCVIKQEFSRFHVNFSAGFILHGVNILLKVLKC